MATLVRYIKKADRENTDESLSDKVIFEKCDKKTDDSAIFTLDTAVEALGVGMFQFKVGALLGLAWTADSMEMMVLSVLSPALQCDWNLDKWQQAMISTCVFSGMMLSGAIWGYVGDRYGRKVSIILSVAMTAYFGLLSSMSPIYPWMLLLRGLVGVGIGGIPQNTTLLAEFLPTSARARGIILNMTFWGVGCCLLVAIALLVMPTLGWRWLLGLSPLSLVFFLTLTPLLPESARFHMARGRSDLAAATLTRIAKMNKKSLPDGTLIQSEATSRGSIRGLLSKPLRRTTLLLWFIWLSCSFCYYGLILLTTELLASGGPCHNGRSAAEANCGCQRLNTADYVDLLVNALAEFPGILLVLPLIDLIGRKKCMATLFGLFSLSMFSLHSCMHRTAMMIMLFTARCFVASVFQVAYVYTPEVYPTSVRAIGMGTCSTMSRIGAIITPFVAQVLLRAEPHAAIASYGLVSLLTGVAAMMLPIETKKRGLQEVHT